MGATPVLRAPRLMRAAGWVLLVAGIFASWAWSEERVIPGRSTGTSVAGLLTFAVLGAATTTLVRPYAGRRRRSWALVLVPVLFGAAAVVAGLVPVVLAATTTGSVTVAVTSSPPSPGYRLFPLAVVTSDRYGQTDAEVTARATDAWAPHLVATVQLADEASTLTCENSRPVWVHQVSTLTLSCAAFRPVSALRRISGVRVVES